jgi:2-aminobenzoylacetyl-CoA thioesterase
MRKSAEGTISNEIGICGHPVYPGYLIRGSRASLMIEAGLNIFGPSYYRCVVSFLGHGSVDYLLVTHGHYDHLGAVTYLKKRIPSLKILGHEMTAQLLQKESVLRTMNFLSTQTWSYFEEFRKEMPDEESILIEPVPFERTLKEGDSVNIGDMHCVVYETPGHTKDHLSFFIPERGLLFPGEALGNAIMQKEDEAKVEFLSSYTQYVESIQKLEALLPQVKILALSHLYYYTGDDVKRFMEMSLRDTVSYRQLIEIYLDRAHGDLEEATKTMVRVEYDEKHAVYQERNAYETNLRAQIKAVAVLRD